MKELLTKVCIVLYLVLKIVGLLIHIATVYIVYKLGGLLAAIGVLFIPLISEIGLVIALWIRLGFYNLYTIGVGSFLILLGIVSIIMASMDED